MKPVSRGRTSHHIVTVVALDIASHVDRLTVRDIAERVGHSVSTVHAALVVLRDAGLVEWSPGRQGTLRSRVQIVARW